MNTIFEKRAELKRKFRNREKMFAGWVSFSHPSITETFCRADFDFMAIDMEHSTISLEEAQRIIAASQSEGVPCLPRPVSHSNDWIKPYIAEISPLNSKTRIRFGIEVLLFLITANSIKNNKDA